MSPPDPGKDDVNSRAPLWRWDREKAFETAKECEQAKTEMKNCGLALENRMPRGKPVEYYCGGSPIVNSPDEVMKKLIAQMWIRADCISTDDPGLKAE